MAGISPYERDRDSVRPGVTIPAWITINEAAHLTGASTADLQTLIRSYQLRAKPVARGVAAPGQVLVKTADLVSLRLLAPQDERSVAPEPPSQPREAKQPLLTSRRILAAALATFLLAGAASAGNGSKNEATDGLACASPGFELKVSTSRDRSSPSALCEKHLEGEVYIFVTPDEGPRRVRFLIDGRFVQLEQNAPWDLAGGDATTAGPLDTSTLADGAHVVEARVTLESRQILNVVAGFTVGDLTPEPTTTPDPEPTEEPTPDPEPTTTPEPTTDPTTDPDPDPEPGSDWTGQAGTHGVTCPAGVITVSPGESIQAAIDRAGSGGTVCIRGEHRLTTAIRPKTGQRIVGENGVLNGTELVTNWVRDGDLWRSDGRTKSFTGGGICERNPIACEAEDLFMDDRPLVRVSTKGAVTASTFYFDESTDQMWIGRDPFGHEFEASAAATGIEGAGVGSVTIQGLVVEKFANHGIVASSGWTITRNELRWNHSHGLRFGQTVTHNFIHHNGNMGIFAQGSGLWYEENELAYNNYLNFSRADGGYWHAGATKIIKSSNVTVLNNYSHHNTGDGWWMDWDNINVRIEGNLFEANLRGGLFYEASFDGVIRDNIFRRNGLDPNERYGSGLFINSSKNVEVVGNTFVGNATAMGVVSTDRGVSDLYGKRETANLFVHENTFYRDGRYVVTVPWGDSTFPVSSARWSQNVYEGGNADARSWDWVRGAVEWSTWRSYGYDADGLLRTQ